MKSGVQLSVHVCIVSKKRLNLCREQVTPEEEIVVGSNNSSCTVVTAVLKAALRRRNLSPCCSISAH